MSKLPFYRKHYRALFEPLLGLMLHGVRVDVPKMKKRHEELRAECREIAKALDHLTRSDICACGHGIDAHPAKRVNIYAGVLRKDGKPRVPRWKILRRGPKGCEAFEPKRPGLVGTKDISNAKLCAYFYDYLKLPEQKAPRGEGISTRTANELACIKLRRIINEYLAQPEYARKRAKLRWKRRPKATLKLIALVLRHKRASKLSTFVNVKKVDADGRMRCTYKFTTITGRLSSSKNPMGGGYNLQNVDREIRDCFVPDEGCVFVEADYSQGETRLLYAMTGDPELLRLARALPGEVDTYRETAARMFGVPLAEVTKDQRRDGKVTTLASGYGMGAWRFAEQLALAGEDKTAEDCEELLEAYFKSRPAVLDYQLWVRQQLMRHRRLVTGWGRELSVQWARLSKEVYKQGYAFGPQSTLGDALNQRGLVPMHRWLRLNEMRSSINLQVHDALVLSCPPNEVHPVMAKLHEEMTQPIKIPTIKGETIKLSIPVEMKVGLNWSFKPGMEFKSLPTPREIRRCLKTLTQ